MDVLLLLRGRPIESVFELLGLKENDITFSIGWALKKSPGLRQALLQRIFPNHPHRNIETITLQKWDDDNGFTDIELSGKDVHVIIEAKRGWQVPTTAQLAKYRSRLRPESGKLVALVTMSECTSEFALPRIEPTIARVPVKHLGWHDVDAMAASIRGTHAERRLLAELRAYLSRIVKMQKQDSNRVFLVVLSKKKPKWSTLTWIQMVEKRGRYFHPVGVRGWPKVPPNYIGFRYGGELRSIHHIDSWKVVTDITPEMPELTPKPWETPHFLYTLGPAIIPHQPVKSRGVFATARLWAMLDLLLTCDTISEACEKTKARQPEEC